MAQQHQLIGLIEIDADPDSLSQDDATLGDALARLRRPAREGADEPTAAWEPGGFDHPESVQVLTADLGQLSWELNVELRQFVERLLATR